MTWAEFPLPSVPEALEFRREQYGWTREMMAFAIGLSKGHYSEVINGKRQLPLNATRHAYSIGVPATVLLQLPK